MGAVNALAFPKPPREWSEADLRNAPELVWLPLPDYDEPLPALHIKVAAPEPKFTLLYSHGNAEDIGLSLGYLRSMAAYCECDVFAAEYVGYSIAPGKPSEQGCFQSIDAAWEYLTNGPPRVPAHRIVPFGRSLGSGPTVDLVSRHPEIAGMVLQSGLESGARAVANTFVSFIGRPLDIFLNYAKIDKVEARTLIIHGTADRVVPASNGRALYTALEKRGLAHEPLWLEGRGHNDLPQGPCLDAVKGLLKHLAKLPEPKGAPSEADEGYRGAPMPVF